MSGGLRAHGTFSVLSNLPIHHVLTWLKSGMRKWQHGHIQMQHTNAAIDDTMRLSIRSIIIIIIIIIIITDLYNAFRSENTEVLEMT